MTPLVLLTGATGYVGGRLLPRLEAAGVRVRCLARHPENVRGRVGPRTDVVRGDVQDPASLASALAGVDTAYYLVHSMTSAGSFEEEDRRAATLFADAARAAGVRRVVYLGGLGDETADLSPHLRSRHEVGRLLAAGGGDVVELRASIVIGSGSLSFEMVRALVERLPAMVTPRWVDVPSQPIAIDDVLAYLEAARTLPPAGHRIVEIGGADRVSYGDLMREYARQRGLRRLMVSVPVLTPRLSGLWLGLVTPVYARVGRRLVDSIRHPTVVRTTDAARLFPTIRPRGLRDSIASALRSEERERVGTRGSDALAVGTSPERGGARLVDSRVVRVAVPPRLAFGPIRRIGGRRGWYFGAWMWALRGALDLAVGGVGMRRGRRDPERLAVGDVLDCSRVEAFEPDRRLRLAAEMRLPGRAWLEFEVTPDGTGSAIRQTAEFDPRGLAGLAYWYGISPLHRIVFAGMLRAIAAAAAAPAVAA